MRGDIDNTQPVWIGGSPTKRRVIYCAQDLPEQRMQVGMAEVDKMQVAVWRPYDPANQAWDAEWRSSPWRNVYHLRLPLDQPGSRPGKVRFGLAQVEVGGLTASLPRVELDLSYHLKEHLASL